jgi:hypothetical protein
MVEDEQIFRKLMQDIVLALHYAGWPVTGSQEIGLQIVTVGL